MVEPSRASSDRIGIHLGEIVIAEHQHGLKPRDLHGIQVDTCARVMSLAAGGEVLMTRAVFDNARQSLMGEEIAGVERPRIEGGTSASVGLQASRSPWGIGLEFPAAAGSNALTP